VCVVELSDSVVAVDSFRILATKRSGRQSRRHQDNINIGLRDVSYREDKKVIDYHEMIIVCHRHKCIILYHKNMITFKYLKRIIGSSGLEGCSK
jgi:hypothetical protein